ncbi:hypothetical protein ACAG25_23215 [Mycobacterium sp. pV006]|uniref:hypothetical protein n=1 Tax=Mycobacterium sp. pV006 TaxID=3238983 RepID=UPI00351B9E33
MTAVATADHAQPKSALERYYELHPAYRLTIRWTLIVAATGVAFHDSWISLAEVARNGSLGGFVWAVPAAAILVAVAVARRKRTELPIHDRQTDIIVGIMGLGLALLIQAVLLPRYTLYFDLLRLDLIAMWLFASSSAVVLFGLRPVIRFAWVWALALLMSLTLPYYLVVITLGGGKTAAGAAALLIAGFGSGIALGTSIRRGVVASLASWVVGFAVLAIIAVFFPDAPVLVFQEVPVLTSLSLVGLVMFFLARRGQPFRVLDRKVEPLAAKQVWSAVPLVVASALALSIMPLPVSPNTPIYPRLDAYPLNTGQEVIPPTGWGTTGEVIRYPVNRLYGSGAVLVRQYVTADNGNPRWDKYARPRTVVVDSIVSEQPHAFGTFPSRVLYGLTSARISEIWPVDLGNGVTGHMVSVVDDDLLVTYTMMQFNWGSRDLTQRIMLIAVDNHEQDAPFPQPTQNLFPMLRTLVTLLFRGNAVLDERTPQFKDAEMLTYFGRLLVAAQLGSSQ